MLYAFFLLSPDSWLLLLFRAGVVLVSLEGFFEEDGPLLGPSDRLLRDRWAGLFLPGEGPLLLGPFRRWAALRILLDLSEKNQVSSGQITGIFFPMYSSIASREYTYLSQARLTALPDIPARAVRPIRCT